MKTLNIFIILITIILPSCIKQVEINKKVDSQQEPNTHEYIYSYPEVDFTLPTQEENLAQKEQELERLHMHNLITEQELIDLKPFL
jgi:hypothetical protein